MTEQLVVFGLTGRMGSGKGEIVRVVSEFGFKYISLGDMVREEIAKLGDNVSRAESQDVGNRMRREGGPGVLGKRVRLKIQESMKTADSKKIFWLVDGIRNPAEITELRQLPHFLLGAIDVEIDTLILRLKARKREDDLANDEELKRRLDREWGIGEPEEGQQVGKCVALADVTIDNNGSLQDLRNNVLKVLDSLGIQK